MAGQVSSSPVIEKVQAMLVAKRAQLSKDEPTKPKESLPKAPSMSDESRQACYERAERAEQERKDHCAKVER